MRTIEDYQGRYSGRLFVCGNAPSLADAYPLLRNEHVFGCNMLLEWDALPFLPTFWAVTEPMINDRWRRYYRNATEWIEHRFAFSETPPEPWDESWTWIPKSRGYVQDLGMAFEPPFPTARTTPLSVGVQAGFYMGFRDFYLCGIELTSLASHVYADGITLTGADGWYPWHEIGVALLKMREAIVACGGRVVNCTPVGHLREIGLPCVPLESVL